MKISTERSTPPAMTFNQIPVGDFFLYTQLTSPQSVFVGLKIDQTRFIYAYADREDRFNVSATWDNNPRTIIKVLTEVSFR